MAVFDVHFYTSNMVKDESISYMYIILNDQAPSSIQW